MGIIYNFVSTCLTCTGVSKKCKVLANLHNKTLNIFCNHLIFKIEIEHRKKKIKRSGFGKKNKRMFENIACNEKSYPHYPHRY